VISTRRRVEYAHGFIALKMFGEASQELHAIPFEEQFSPIALGAWIDLHLAEERWDIVEGLSRKLLAIDPENAGAWITLGCAIRRTDSVTAARDLLRGLVEKFGAAHAVFHYNLACYHCLLGETAAARESLANACRMDAAFKETALDDPDLKAMWDEPTPSS